MQVNHRAVKQFVREVLGCHCPEEVFNRIEVARLDARVKNCAPDYQMNIGGRLLIWVTCEEALGSRGLPEMMQEGKAARDAGRFNRFRLVVLSEQPIALERSLSQPFEELRAEDDRLHFHVIAKHALPDLA